MNKTIISLKDGQTYYYPNTSVQEKNNGEVLAVFDCTTYRIIAEFKMELVKACRRSDQDDDGKKLA
jgi:hypothetical protein